MHWPFQGPLVCTGECRTESSSHCRKRSIGITHVSMMDFEERVLGLLERYSHKLTKVPIPLGTTPLLFRWIMK